MNFFQKVLQKCKRERGHAYRQAGFTLLLAALVASIAVSLGASIFDIAQKEVSLSSIGRDSQFAFYAADTAAECALYWDVRFGAFATSSASSAPTSQSIECDGQPTMANPYFVAPSYYVTPTLTAATTTYAMSIFTDSTQGGYCIQVYVGKSLDSQTNAERTIIDANGYNVPCAAVDTSPTALQRTVQLNY